MAALDPFRGYGAALSAVLPHAARVLDPFHAVRLGFAAVDDVRRRVQQDMRVGHGFRNVNNYRLRLLLHCAITWHHQISTPLGGRLPRLAA